MGLNRGLQLLIERAWTLHHHISAQIENSTSFCRFCSQHGRYCAIVETPFPEKESLIAIRGSLQQVRDMLMFLQKLQHRHSIERQEALDRLEKSRVSLIEEIKRYKGTPLNVLEELNSSFNNGKSAFDWFAIDGKAKNLNPCSPDDKTRAKGFAIFWIKVIFDPWKWRKAVVFAANLLIISASITSTVHLCNARQRQNHRSQRKALTFMDSTDPNNPVHVFHGRG